MTATLEHRAVLRHRQVLAAATAARSRTISLHWVTVTLMMGLLAAVWAGDRFTFWFVQQLPFSWMFAIGLDLPTIIPALFAFFVVIVIGSFQQRAIARAYLRNFTRLGIPSEIEALFEVLPDGLRLRTDRITIFPRWHAVDTVERAADGWVVSADQLTFLLPSESFSDKASEQAMVAAIVGHLTADARERSPQAVAFAMDEASPSETEQSKPAEPAVDPPPDALKVSGEISRQEASWAARIGYDRIAHPNRHAFLYPALSGLVGGMLGLVAAGLLMMLLPIALTLGNAMMFIGMAFLLTLVGGAAGLWLGYRRLGTLFDRAYHSALSSRGSPSSAECQWEITEDGLVVRSARGSSTTRWQAIAEVFPADAFWIALSDIAVVVIPRRAFAEEPAERAFIAALLARLPELARERSADAVAFASGGTA